MLSFYKCPMVKKCPGTLNCSHSKLHQKNEVCSHDCHFHKDVKCKLEITVEVGYEKNGHDGGPESAHYGTEHELMHAGLLIKKENKYGHIVEMFLRTPCGTYDECVPEILEELLNMMVAKR